MIFSVGGNVCILDSGETSDYVMYQSLISISDMKKYYEVHEAKENPWDFT